MASNRITTEQPADLVSACLSFPPDRTTLCAVICPALGSDGTCGGVYVTARSRLLPQPGCCSLGATPSRPPPPYPLPPPLWVLRWEPLSSNDRHYSRSKAPSHGGTGTREGKP
ncbi:predicted protein [Aspergillus terreus NIH2624]|uniref:Uncharacterized protein n=1 Tax=Aspergillus terreus (strain NIH 2624 / FGSC A1156) TaxID=341663 RepID=Q0CUV5_ASPTN|nr:uncharacterized protein ATEG_02529 [Aspergillus terreus NIH2624]EAU37491.1 predicted protein [Aspergillus terreus NIH2624]